MRAGYGRAVIAVAAMVTLAACGGDRAPQLMNLRSGQGPDEFAIVPPKALEMPQSLSDLPEPTPGGYNRTDQNPEADAAVALGGKPTAAGGIPTGDSALYAHAARHLPGCPPPPRVCPPAPPRHRPRGSGRCGCSHPGSVLANRPGSRAFPAPSAARWQIRPAPDPCAGSSAADRPCHRRPQA